VRLGIKSLYLLIALIRASLARVVATPFFAFGKSSTMSPLSESPSEEA